LRFSHLFQFLVTLTLAALSCLTLPYTTIDI
jgi:hypothetical protein